MRRLLSLVPAALMLTACVTGNGLMTRSQPAATPPAPVGKAAAPGDFVLDATAQGECITFALTNKGTEVVTLDPGHFAVVPKGTRQVMPYDPENVVLELAAPDIAPGETVKGRAIFRELSEPTGCRLVYKPDARFTSAVVGMQQGRLAPAPSNRTH